MNVFRINFDEIYRRHLRRHGHFGINILHLLAVVGIYISVFGLAGFVVKLIDADHAIQILLGLTLPWFLVVAFNVPFRVTVVTGLFVLLLLAGYRVLPEVPFWMWIILIFAMHRFQQWSHNVYHMHRDMSEFSDKYSKGFVLFVLLLVYELPILLNYLLFGRPDWVMGRERIVSPENA